MRADDVKPWALLFSKLRRSDDARVSYDEVLAAGAEPVLMVRERILEYGKDDGYEPAGCEHAALDQDFVGLPPENGLVPERRPVGGHGAHARSLWKTRVAWASTDDSER